MGNKLYSIVYWLTFALLSVFFFLVAATLFLLTFLFDRKGILLHQFSCLWAVTVFRANPLWRLQVTGRERIRWGRPYIIVANHRSIFDVALFSLFRPFKWLAKRNLRKLPLIGWNMVLNRYIFIDRKDPESRRQGYERCRWWLRQGVSVLIFPEGTRSKTGGLGDFHTGAFRLAVEEGLPLVPVVLQGTENILQSHSFSLAPGRKRICVNVLEPILPGTFQNDQIPEFQTCVRTRMEAALSG